MSKGTLTAVWLVLAIGLSCGISVGYAADTAQNASLSFDTDSGELRYLNTTANLHETNETAVNETRQQWERDHANATGIERVGMKLGEPPTVQDVRETSTADRIADNTVWAFVGGYILAAVRIGDVVASVAYTLRPTVPYDYAAIVALLAWAVPVATMLRSDAKEARR